MPKQLEVIEGIEHGSEEHNDGCAEEQFKWVKAMAVPTGGYYLEAW